MALLNTSLPNLIGGVSQQPDSVRFEGQCEEQTNAISSVVDGLSKRPNTQHLAKIVSSAISSNSFVHFVDRSDDEKYVVIHEGATIKVFNLDGTPCSINSASSYTASGSSYLYSATPRQDLKALTVGDTTFLLNTTKTVNASSSNTSVLEKFGIFTVKQGDFEREYKATADVLAANGAVTATKHAWFRSGNSASSNSKNSNSNAISRALHLLMGTSSSSHAHTEFENTNHDEYSTGGWDTYFGTPVVNQNNIYLTLGGSGTDFRLRTEDSLANTALSAAYKEVPSITDLPTHNKNGFRIKVRGSAEINEDDYYVKFETVNGSTYGEGTYTETVGFGISEGVDNATLPHKLVCTAPNTFTLAEATYTARQVGDDDTNPQPSFVSPDANTPRTISNIFFFKNRLGFLSEDKVIMSEAGEPYNFFRTTITTLLDSDPIDVQVSSQKVTNLKSATGFQENLILFSENSQFVLKGGDLLTPKTISVTPVTNFDSASSVNPIPLGAYMYFPFEGGSFTGVREYTVNASTDVYDSTEISEHIPTYIPKDLFMFAGSSTEDALAMVSQEDKGSIFVYRFFFNGQKKLLSSWFKFTLDGEIRGISFSKSDLFIVLAKGTETHLLKMPFDAGLKDDGVSHNTYLDMRRSVSVASGATTIDLSSFYTPADNAVKVYTTDGALIPSTNSGATVTLTNGALSSSGATSVWVGIPYTMTYTFSKQLFKQASGQTKTPSAGGSMMIKNCAVFYNNTAHFDVKVTPLHRDTYLNTFNPNIINTTNIALQLDDGFFRVPVFSNSEDTTITIENSSALPSNFQSAEFEVNAHQRSRRF
tara:strand:+ start:9445 stop:11904 length:2460 start_codon:yes stop_codon:yes gene_type:complete